MKAAELDILRCMEERILDFLRKKAALGRDQGLEVREIAEQLGADQEDVLIALQKLQARGLAYEQSFWWYPGEAPASMNGIDQA
jgi:DNA-binding MarR family transcriptional regulator